MKVILVEDEPTALRYLRSTLELRCAGCEIVATAESGTEGLKKVRELRPDLVITDIRMAGMDGIQLAERLRKEFPEIYSVIVSGYQDFNYARGALHSGVVDYLLKPVRAAELRAVVEKIGARVRRDVYDRRVTILRGCLTGGAIDDWQIGKYLPFGHFCAALLRFGGLPSRFGVGGSDAKGPLPQVPGLLEQDVWAVAGRDGRETLFFCAEELTRPAGFRRVVASFREQEPHGYSTLVFGAGSSLLSGCAGQVTILRHVLDGMIVPGLSQTHQLEGTPAPGRRITDAVLDPSRDSRMDFLLTNASYPGLESELRDLASEWERDRRPLVSVESAVRQIVAKVVKTSGNPGGVPPAEIEFQMDGLLSRLSSYGELASGAWDVVQQVLGTGARRDADIPSLHAAIVRYVEQNCPQPLTLQSVCDRFRVSQTTVSRLFRRFEGASFVEYLTRLRVDMAKRLMGEHPEMPLKDVAAYVGYHDQFYFSRVFKSLAGVPPSEWISPRRDD